jgi:CAAX prenyl protease-like protein
MLKIPQNSWLPYIAPMALYFVFLAVQTNANLVWLYPIKTLAVAGVLWWFRRSYTELHCSTRAPRASAGSSATAAGEAPALQTFGWAVAAGLLAIAIWIGIDPVYPKLSSAAPFDPSGRYAFITFRIVGAVLVVPVMEELFWRAFLIRWLVKDDFKSVPVGTFTWRSFVITVALFGLEHNQWLAGLICGAIYNMLLYRTRSVWACVVAHATSNAALAAWVLARSDWKFW